MTTAATKEVVTLFALAVAFTAGAISIAVWGRAGDHTRVYLELVRASAVVSWIVLAIVVGTHRVLHEVRTRAAQIKAEVKAARELAMSEIHTLYKRLGDQVAAKEFEQRLTAAEEGDSGSLRYLHDRGLRRGTGKN